MTTLIIATRNAHKVGEIRAILGRGYRIMSMQDFPEAPPVVEDQATFAKNAAKKAREIAKWLQYRPDLEFRVPGASASVLADDSGLEVDALQGAPGVHSARFAALDSGAAGNSSDAENNAKLLRLLQDVPLEKRTARFSCALSVMRVKPQERTLSGFLFEGTCEGHIQLGAAGQGGFGYDPLFIPRGQTQSFAQLGDDVKNRISHRAQALAKMHAALQSLVTGSDMPGV